MTFHVPTHFLNQKSVVNNSHFIPLICFICFEHPHAPTHTHTTEKKGKIRRGRKKWNGLFLRLDIKSKFHDVGANYLTVVCTPAERNKPTL